MKKQVCGNYVYILHLNFQNEVYSFIGNKQAFSNDDRTPSMHIEELTYMFASPLDIRLDIDSKVDLDYYFKVLNYYPQFDNANRVHQGLLNEEKKKYINIYKNHHHLANLTLYKDETKLIKQFMMYNRDRRLELKQWYEDNARFEHLCLLSNWLVGKDIDYINKLPRYYWYNLSYIEKLKEKNLYPDSDDVLKILMICKDNLVNRDFIERLSRFALYGKSTDYIISETIKERKLYHRNKKKYTDDVHYASSYMYVVCKKHQCQTEYQLYKKEKSQTLTLSEIVDCKLFFSRIIKIPKEIRLINVGIVHIKDRKSVV